MEETCRIREWTSVRDTSLTRQRQALHLGACATCGSVTWRTDADELDAAVAMEQLFGSFELVGQMAAIGAPGVAVLAYRPPNRRTGQVLETLTAGEWLEGQPGLWMTTDGSLLLLSPTDPVFTANLTRGA